jgi:hypothetical protein
VLTKKDMAELKAYAKPPALVELTLGGKRCAGQGNREAFTMGMMCSVSPGGTPMTWGHTGR